MLTQHSFQAIRKNEDKIRIVLNKVRFLPKLDFVNNICIGQADMNDVNNMFVCQADMMTHQQLMRVYGALMWSLSRILQAPEVSRSELEKHRCSTFQTSAVVQIFG